MSFIEPVPQLFIYLFTYLLMHLEIYCVAKDGAECLVLLPPLLNAEIACVCHHAQFMGARDGTQGFVHATKVLYQLRYISRPRR